MSNEFFVISLSRYITALTDRVYRFRCTYVLYIGLMNKIARSVAISGLAKRNVRAYHVFGPAERLQTRYAIYDDEDTVSEMRFGAK